MQISSKLLGVLSLVFLAATTVLRASETFLPPNGAVNISPDQQLRIVFSETPKLGSGNLYVRDASDNSIFATIDTSQFVTHTMWNATFSNNLYRTTQGRRYYYQPIAIHGNVAWVTVANRFAYNKSYYVNYDTGLFLDGANLPIPGITGTTWMFSTKTAGPATPTASTGPTDITIGLDGTGDFATLQGASDWIPQNNTLMRTISILPGIYRDMTVFDQNRNNVRIIGTGTSREDVQFIYLYPGYDNLDNWSAGVLRLISSDIFIENLTIDNQVYMTNNGVVFAGPINTLFSSGNRLVFDNVLIKGGQDTYLADRGIAYFNNCEVWGSVDFIYGGALAVFDQCKIVEIRTVGGPIAAPSTPYGQPYGMVFLNCSFPRALKADGYPYDVGTGNTTFMRPWRQDGRTAIINCSVGTQFSTKGWSEWDGKETTCHAREVGTTLIGGGSVTPAQRQAAGAYWLNTVDPDYSNPNMNPKSGRLFGSGTNNRVAVIVNPNDYTLSAIFGHSYFNLNGWMP
jgi:pectin methylesterase-like acyl-CoA thioesterase